MILIMMKIFKYHTERKQKKINYFWLTENPEVEKLTYFRKEKKEKIF